MRGLQFLGCTIFLAATLHAAPAAKPISFRVMTYNIHHGEGIDNRIDLPRIAALIKREKADIVALQEVDKGVTRTSGRDLTAELAKLTGFTGVFSNNFHYQGGEYGNAILTRFPVLEQINTHYKMLHTNEQRGVLQLVLEVRGKKVLFLCTHIDYHPEEEERLLNVSELKSLLMGREKMPMIVCGDFNCVPESQTHAKMKEFLSDSWELVGRGPGLTIPTAKPNIRIDYIWVNKDLVQPNKLWVPKTIASDHLPVVGEFNLR